MAFFSHSPQARTGANHPGVIVIAMALSLALLSADGMAFGARFPRPQEDEEAPPPSAPPKKPVKTDPNPVMAPAGSMPPVKADQKKGKEAYKKGLKAEGDGDWATAFEAYSDAVNFDATVIAYGLHQAIAKSHVVQAKIEAAEKAADAGGLTAALSSQREARELDPSNQVLAERLAQMDALGPRAGVQTVAERQLAPPVRLDHLPGTQNLQLRGQTQSAYEESAKKIGGEGAVDGVPEQGAVRVKMNGVEFATAMRVMGQATGTFWRPLTAHLFLV